MMPQQHRQDQQDEDRQDRRVRYAINRQPGNCEDCGRPLAPGQARIWSRGKHRKWGVACRYRKDCPAKNGHPVRPPCDVCGAALASAEAGPTCGACLGCLERGGASQAMYEDSVSKELFDAEYERRIAAALDPLGLGVEYVGEVAHA